MVSDNIKQSLSLCNHNCLHYLHTTCLTTCQHSTHFICASAITIPKNCITFIPRNSEMENDQNSREPGNRLPIYMANQCTKFEVSS